MNTSHPLQPIDREVCVAPQLHPEAMAEAARAGFRSVVTNRPDFEGDADQPTSAQVDAAALAAGLAYHHLPVNSGYQSAEELQSSPSSAKSCRGRCCRSGARSARL